ncbi:restriction endonuclease [Pseudoclavibacter sp. VKM Ac-2888]|uniref:restriction endonuclease n=1 Tax=Pseudoclavibacter sp. VKM Ac-2888 TaxID=2783830 RepID=UPI00188C2F3A|nr:restriction endonuclease [Pseudoclavibacter sp. VKM Ac-2888]MBF4548704.1 restriction endonuclease [Pseudoclavibacter sp. VKM Ac-2888]
MAEAAWSEFQEAVKETLNQHRGVCAETNKRIQGTRTHHNIDVYAEFTALGAPIKWLIECKLWKTGVTKEKVLAFHKIVEETGADRGLLIAENGYQSGAFEAAENANVELVSFTDFKRRVEEEVAISRLTGYIARLAVLHHRYWQHPKAVRKDYDLRLDPYSMGGGSAYEHYPIRGIISIAEGVIDRIQLRLFPLKTNSTSLTWPSAVVGTDVIHNVAEGVNWLDANVREMEKHMDKAEQKMAESGDFKPKPGGGGFGFSTSS